MSRDSPAQRFRTDDGMEQLIKIVADLYKDVKLIKSASALPGAERYAAKRQGWTATAEDITGPDGEPDGVDEILIRDKQGNIRVVNGFTTSPSHHPQRQAYQMDVKRNDKGRPIQAMKPFMSYLTETTGGLDENGYETIVYKHQNPPSKAGKYLQKKLPSPKKVYADMVKFIWEEVKAEDQDLSALPVQSKLWIYQTWLNGTYKIYVVEPLFSQANINYNAIPYKQDISKITKQANFKKSAYNALAFIHQNMNGQLDTIKGELVNVIGSRGEKERIVELFGSPKIDRPKGTPSTDIKFPQLISSQPPIIIPSA